MSSIGNWLRGLGHSLSGTYNLLTGLWSKVLDIKTKTVNILGNAQRLVTDSEAIVQDIRTFEVNPKWNTRVISVPKVIDHVKELYALPERIITDVKDLSRLLKEKIEPAEVNLEDVEGLDGVPTKLLKAGEKILGWATLVFDALVTIESAIDDLQDILTSLRDTLEGLHNLDALFLGQGNPKKTVDEHYRKRLRS